MSYTPELVVRLLPAVWDQTIVAVDNPMSPDPDMPKVKSDPKLSGTILAMLADIRSAWKDAPLLLVDRQTLLLTYGLDWVWYDVAHCTGTERQATVSERNSRGLGVLLHTLNGKEWNNDTDVTEDEGDK